MAGNEYYLSPHLNPFTNIPAHRLMCRVCQDCMVKEHAIHFAAVVHDATKRSNGGACNF
jgi:hypothetical protein